MCRGKAGASERRPYQDDAYPPAEGSPKGRLRGGGADVHPALSSPSATPLRSGDTRRG